MRRKLTAAFAVLSMLLLLAGVALVGYFAWKTGANECIFTAVGLVVSLVLAPILHELGHVWAAKANQMETVRLKCFCLLYQKEQGKGRVALVSPFAPDETQVMPKTRGNMQKRAMRYTLGGLWLEGGFCLLFLAAALLLTAFQVQAFAFWGALPYCAYLFILNALPLEYPSGKTDALVYIGLKRGAPAEQNMLSAMEIHGGLYEGNTFAQMDGDLYFSAPQLCEDEPLFAVMLDLRYRYFLDKDELERAADCLNRLAQAQAYLADEEVEKLAAELVYMHSLNGDKVRADECGKLCEEYLRSECVSTKRALAAYCKAFGGEDRVLPLKEQAYGLLEKENCKGLAAWEKKLLEKI